MARERTDMRKSREILRHILQLKLSYKVVEASLSVSHGLVCRTLTKVRERGLAWPEIEPLSDDELETRPCHVLFSFMRALPRSRLRLRTTPGQRCRAAGGRRRPTR